MDVGDYKSMVYKTDGFLTIILLNIYEHLKKNYDYTLIVVGDTGTGKSMFCLHLLETWYKIVLKEEFNKGHIKNINTDYLKWIRRFKQLKAYDMNIFDEGATSLDSKQHMEKVSKDITKLFNVFRCKRFLSVIVLPSFFYLNKYFRENRLRGLVWINERGNYRWYTKQGIKWLNANNERRTLKSMGLAYPIHENKFPDYQGVLKQSYEVMKNEGVDKILDEVLGDNKKKVTLVDVYKDEVKQMVADGKKHWEIRQELGISGFYSFKVFGICKD